jgi:two-component system response regulator YesN
MYRLLIADDDEITREGIRKYLLKKFLNIETIWTAQNGQEAFSLYEEHKPDIIFTDVAMPISDGMELLYRIHQNGYSPKTVIISAHENFSYAQNAVRLGVEDYLIKPVMPDEIYTVTSKLMAELDQHYAFLRNVSEIMNSYKESLPVLRQRLFSILVQGNVNAKVIMEKTRQVDIDLSGYAYTVAVLKVAPPDNGANQHPFTADGFVRFLSAASGDFFPEHIRVYNFIDNGSNVVLIAVSGQKDPDGLFRAMNQFLDILMNSVKTSVGLSIEKAAMGKQYSSMEDITRSYQEALNMLITVTDNSQAGSVCNYEEVSAEKKIEIKVDSNLEINLLHFVKYQPYDKCLTVIDQIEKQISNYRYSKFDYIKTYFLQLTVLMWREYQQLNDGKTDFQVEFGGLLGTSDLDACLLWFKTFVRNLVSNYQLINHEKGHWLVNRAKRIINDNLSNCSFSLNNVAAALYVSSNYLRSLFKQQSDESFVEYLTRIRMEKSIDLLKNTNMKIQEVAEMTGYSNQRYFSVCFKKHFGKTPTEIRERAI